MQDAGPESWLAIIDHWAAILTAAVAVWAWGQYQFGRRNKREKLEAYLAKEKPGGRSKGDSGARTILHLAAELKMSDTEIMDAAFRSERIECVKVADNATRRTTEIMLKYLPK